MSSRGDWRRRQGGSPGARAVTASLLVISGAPVDWEDGPSSSGQAIHPHSTQGAGAMRTLGMRGCGDVGMGKYTLHAECIRVPENRPTIPVLAPQRPPKNKRRKDRNVCGVCGSMVSMSQYGATESALCHQSSGKLGGHGTQPSQTMFRGHMSHSMDLASFKGPPRRVESSLGSASRPTGDQQGGEPSMIL